MKPAETPFLGIAYSLRSQSLADQRLINLYPEIVEGKSGAAAVGAFYGCPGLDLVATVGNGPIRGMLEQEGFLLVVSGATVYKVDTSYNAIILGTLGTALGPVSMVANATQQAIFDGVGGYSYSGGIFAPIALPFSNPGTADYMDGFVLINEVGTFNLWQSNLNDLTTWDPLNFTTEDGTPSNVVTLIEFQNQFAIMKEDHFCFYINAGNPGFVFQRLQGVYGQVGVSVAASFCQIEETLLFLGQSPQGGRTVYMIKGYQEERVSTHALEYAMGTYATISDAIGFAYSQEGHHFYVLTFPSANATWVLDLTASKKMGVPAWHERASFANGQFGRYAANCFAYFKDHDLLVGDYQSGTIYKLNLDSFTDNGAQRKWLRSWRATPRNMYEPLRFNFLELAYQSGTQVPDGSNPQVVLRYSDDSFNWTADLIGAAGQTGEYANTLRWNRLGMTRRGINSDRIFELSSTDPFKVALFGAIVG
jgi:hypothetical protein